MHHGAGGERGLASAIQTFKQAWTTFERSGAALAASGTNEAVGPATLEQEGGATRLVGERFLKLGERTAPRHALVSSQSRACSRTAQTQHIAEPKIKGISLYSATHGKRQYYDNVLWVFRVKRRPVEFAEIGYQL